jgi:uncharacterized membrane protein
VFAFAVTLLVVSLEVPRTFGELRHLMREFVPFGISFVFLLWIWHQHTRFFRRFRLDDALTHAVNGLLLFVVLFYVYPLKFLWTMLFRVFTGGPMEVKLPDGTLDRVITSADSTQLFYIYGSGFMAIFLGFALLYASVYWRRAKLALDELGAFDARWAILEYLGVASVGLLSMLIASFGPRWTMWAGFSYMLIGVVKWVHGSQAGERRSSLARRLVLAQAVAGRSPLEEKTHMGIPGAPAPAAPIEETRLGPPQPPKRKLDDTG